MPRSICDAPEERCQTSFDVAWAAASPFEEPAEHELCVRVEAEESSTEETSTICRTFRSLPFRKAYVWNESTPSPRTTAPRIPLTCSRADGSEPNASAECVFACSLDGRPFAPCGDTLTLTNLAPTEHVLRVETRGPYLTPEHEFARVRTVRWTVDWNAQPEHVPMDFVPLPEPLSRKEIEDRGLGALLDAYGPFALACASSDAPQAEHDANFERSLSRALMSPHVVPSQGDGIARCLRALRAEPPPCRSLPGWRDSYTQDGELLVRLPEDCGYLFLGTLEPGAPCLSHEECAYDGLCEWGGGGPYGTLGFCTDNDAQPERHEGILCAARGCSDGLFCLDGLCARTLPTGARCEAYLESADCGPEQVCTGGDQPRCAPND